jgi:hypothetical protein
MLAACCCFLRVPLKFLRFLSFLLCSFLSGNRNSPQTFLKQAAHHSIHTAHFIMIFYSLSIYSIFTMMASPETRYLLATKFADSRGKLIQCDNRNNAIIVVVIAAVVASDTPQRSSCAMLDTFVSMD